MCPTRIRDVEMKKILTVVLIFSVVLLTGCRKYAAFKDNTEIANKHCPILVDRGIYISSISFNSLAHKINVTISFDESLVNIDFAALKNDSDYQMSMKRYLAQILLASRSFWGINNGMIQHDFNYKVKLQGVVSEKSAELEFSPLLVQALYNNRDV